MPSGGLTSRFPRRGGRTRGPSSGMGSHSDSSPAIIDSLSSSSSGTSLGWSGAPGGRRWCEGSNERKSADIGPPFGGEPRRFQGGIYCTYLTLFVCHNFGKDD